MSRHAYSTLKPNWCYTFQCQRTRQNVFECLLSNNLKIRKESHNSSLEEKA